MENAPEYNENNAVQEVPDIHYRTFSEIDDVELMNYDESAEATKATKSRSDSDLETMTSVEDVLKEKQNYNVHENLSKLREKVDTVEKYTKDLKDVIEYLTKDKDIIDKLEEIEPFPLLHDKAHLRRMLWTLEKRISALESPPELRRSHFSTQHSIQIIKKPKHRKQITPLDALLEPGGGDTVLQSVYGVKTNGDILYNLRRELEEMTQELDKWHETNRDILETLNDMKTPVPSQALCGCVKDVQVMKRAIDIMTGGQYLKGNDIDFLNPNRVKYIETKLSETGDQLRNIEDIMQQMKYYQTQMKVIKKKFAPYLASIISGEPLPGETEQKDIGLDKLHDRIKVIEEDMKKINEISAQLLTSQNERDNRIARIKEEIELLRRLKVDKEDVEDVLTEKDDPSNMEKRVNIDILYGVLQCIAEFSNCCMKDLVTIEEMWQRLMLDIREEIETKANKKDLSSLRERIKKVESTILYRIKELKKLIDLDPHKRELKTFKCVSCGKDIIPKYKSKDHSDIENSTSLQDIPTKDQQYKKPRSRSSIELDFTCGTEDGINRYCGGGHTVTTPQQRVTRECHYQIIPTLSNCDITCHP